MELLVFNIPKVTRYVVTTKYLFEFTFINTNNVHSYICDSTENNLQYIYKLCGCNPELNKMENWISILVYYLVYWTVQS